MPEEIAFVVVLAIIAGTLMISSIARGFFKYLSAKAGVRAEEKKAAKSPSLTTSELESMLRRVVEESNESLVSRIEKIEDELAISRKSEKETTKGLPAHKSDSILDDFEDGPNDLAAISQRKSRTV